MVIPIVLVKFEPKITQIWCNLKDNTIPNGLRNYFRLDKYLHKIGQAQYFLCRAHD